jgi:hypothetical protein
MSEITQIYFYFPPDIYTSVSAMERIVKDTVMWQNTERGTTKNKKHRPPNKTICLTLMRYNLVIKLITQENSWWCNGFQQKHFGSIIKRSLKIFVALLFHQSPSKCDNGYRYTRGTAQWQHNDVSRIILYLTTTQRMWQQGGWYSCSVFGEASARASTR